MYPSALPEQPFQYLFYVPEWDNSFASRKHLPPYPVFVTMVIPRARRRRNGSSGMDRIGFLVNDGMTCIGRWHSMCIGPSLLLSLTLLRISPSPRLGNATEGAPGLLEKQ